MLSAWLSDLTAPFAWLVGWGHESTYVVSRWLFLRLLGAVFLVAFVSIWVQLAGLIGRRGILPAADFLEGVGERLGRGRLRWVPTVFWLDARDRTLHLACGAGVVLALLLTVGIAPPLCLAGLWVLYLSLVIVGQEFLAFQWDVLLVEMALLAILVAPWSFSPRAQAAVPAVGLVLTWWLLFRLMFQSGIVKLTSGDPAWRDLSALDYHWWTQPLPTWIGWWAHQTPRWFKRAAVLGTFVLEIGFPLLIFGPRSLRLVGCGGILLMQVLIMATGNYTFFNVLTIALAVLLIDDAVWAALGWCPNPEGCAPGAGAAMALGPELLGLLVAGPVLAVSGARLWRSLRPQASLPRGFRRVIGWIEPFRVVNSYGLFRVMTTSRPEIEVQGSRDGREWQTYHFRWKPDEPERRPRFVEPHQPRLDWQMWFAALSGFHRAPWFARFLTRLLEGSPAVLRLLRTNPFGDEPPRFVRARLWDYRFASIAERWRTGRWWTRTLSGEFGPILTSRGTSPAASRARQ